MLKYHELIEQTFYFPSEEFRTENNELLFHDVNLMKVVKQYGTPLRLTYLPKISTNIQKAKKWFDEAITKHQYEGSYNYCYCTKSSHFSFVLEEALKNGIHLETSSAYDIDIIRALHAKGKLDKSIYIICNGYKTTEYQEKIVALIHDGFHNCVPVADTPKELDYYNEHIKVPCQLGLRVSSDEEPDSQFYTSRLGIRYNDIADVYKSKIASNPLFSLKLLHFFVNTGIRDTSYYWNELAKFIDKYCELKKIVPELDSVDIGGGFPIKTGLGIIIDYEYLVDQIVENVKDICLEADVKVPHLFTEFGSFTVGEAGAMIFSVIGQKQQSDKELWYMVDGSFITSLPDVWGIGQKFILLALNHWQRRYHRVNIGGITCDKMDYYNSDTHRAEVYLPKFEEGEELYVGFFHMGAYQESLSGYGGIKHCLIPSPQHVLISKDEEGNISTRLFAPHQNIDSMMKILGYKE
jgi:arginine decarboxylase